MGSLYSAARTGKPLAADRVSLPIVYACLAPPLIPHSNRRFRPKHLPPTTIMGELLPEELEMAKRMKNVESPAQINNQYHHRADGGAVKNANLLAVPETVSLRSIVSITEINTMDRETWGKKIDFLLSVIGFAVDLGNVWRFPYLCYKNGGGAFLIPYVTMVCFAGVPLFYMELALGQYNRQGAITTWGRICPLLKGVGYGVVMIAFFVDFFYNVIISWALYFLFASMASKQPWSSCNNTWNSLACSDPSNWTSSLDFVCLPEDVNLTRVSAPDEYFNKHVYPWKNKAGEKLHDIMNPGNIQWKLTLCLLGVYIICYFSLWKGIKMSGKVVWFTAVFPYIVLVCLLIRGVTLPGAIKGITYYLKPNLSMLWKGEVWSDAAIQVFFSLGPGFGVLMAFASYNKFHNNVYRDAIITSSINCFTSFLSGFVIFSVLGYMSCQMGVPIDKVAAEGTVLVFVVYPEALSTMFPSTLWCLLFFMMLITLGLDSSFGGSEAIITALSDEFPIIKKKREIFVFCLFALYFLVGLTMCTKAGLLFVEWTAFYGASHGLILAVLCEVVCISYIYGIKRFVADLKEMLGFEPGIYWKVCWTVFGPAFLAVILIFNLYKQLTDKPFGLPDYDYPTWMTALGLIVSFSSAAIIPIVAVIQLIKAKGNTFTEKLKSATTPWKETVDPYTITAIRHTESPDMFQNIDTNL